MTEVKERQTARIAESDGDRLDAVDEQLVEQLADRARSEGLQLTGEGGLLARLTKRVVESAIEGGWMIISAMASTTRPGATAVTRVTAPGRRRC